MAKPPILNQGRLQTHFDQVLTILQNAADATAVLKFETERTDNQFNVSIVGDGCERAKRTKGPDSPVAPWIDLRDGLWSWFGYREEWIIRSVNNRISFVFKSASLTVHFGFKACDPKPQMFRAEWAAPIAGTASQWIMPAGDAGYQTLRSAFTGVHQRPC